MQIVRARPGRTALVALVALAALTALLLGAAGEAGGATTVDLGGRELRISGAVAPGDDADEHAAADGVSGDDGGEPGEPDRHVHADGTAPGGGAAADDVIDAQAPAEEPAPGVLRLRVPGGLDTDTVRAAAALPGVSAVTVTRSATIGLTGSRRADGAVVDALGGGFRIPVAATAVDPESSPAVLAAQGASTATERAAAGLQPGEVLVTEEFAAERGLAVGAELDLGGRTGLRVVAVVPVDAFRRTEIAVHVADADDVGIGAASSVTVLHDAAPGEATEVLAAALADLAPPDRVARVSVPSEGGTANVPQVLGLQELKARFGEFSYRPRPGVREIDIDPAFVAEHITSARVPLLGSVTCHRAILDDLRSALDEVVDAGLSGWVVPGRYGGCFHARHIAVGRDRLSSHSWGVAIDINVDLSLPGLGPVPPDEVIDIFARNGFRWGGDFTTPDNHHWEWVGDRATERRLD